MGTDPGISDDYLPMDAKRLLELLHTALNTRDTEGLMRLFQVDYESIPPARPGQETTGLSGMRERWEKLFETMPGFRADLIRSTVEGSEIWSEWRWHDSEEEGGMDVRGVMIFGVEDGLLAWSREYMQPVETTAGEENRWRM